MTSLHLPNSNLTLFTTAFGSPKTFDTKKQSLTSMHLIADFE